MRKLSAAIIALLLGTLAAWSVVAWADCTLPSTPNDGYFDQTWAGAGKGCITFVGDNRNATTTSQVTKIAVTTNGNLLVAGDTSSGSGSWWIGELTSQGAFDATFGDSDSSGRITGCQMFLPGGCPTDGRFDFLPQPDGKILILSNRYLARTNAGGHAFDAAGVTGGLGHVDSQFQIATPPGMLFGSDYGALALTAGNKIFMAGYGFQSSVSADNLFGVARLDSDLSLDTSFHATTENAVVYAGGEFVATGDNDEAHDILVQSTGRTVLVGTKGSDYRLTRLNTDGTVDATFGTSGVTVLPPLPAPCTTSYFAYVPYHVAAIDRGDRILVAGECYDNSYITVVARLTADGMLDTANFGNGGFYVNSAFAACPSLAVRPRALAVDTDGRILVGGTCDGEFGVQRLRGDGTLDTSFGIDGLAHGRFDPTSTLDEVDAITFDRSGHPIIGGWTRIPGQPSQQPGVARLTYDLIYYADFDSIPRGCLPPDCN
jgi:uncharacterized delta-60 repeat protein